MNRLLCLLLICTSSALAQSKLAVAVLTLTGTENITQGELEAVTSRFETELVNDGSFVVLERNRMDAILQEQGFQQGGACNTTDCQVQVGQLLGVDRIFVGSVSKMAKLVSLNMKQIHVGTGATEKSKAIDVRGGLDKLLLGGCRDLVLYFGRGIEPPSIAKRNADSTQTLGAALVPAAGQSSRSIATNIPAASAKPTPMSRSRISAYGCYGLGAVALGLGVWQNQQVAAARSNYESATDQSTMDSEYSKGSDAETLRTIFFASGAMLLATGLTLHIVF